MAAETAVLNTCRLFLFDKLSKYHFLIDTGSDISIIPSTNKDKYSKISNGLQLFAANATRIKTYGQKTIEV